MPGDGVAVDDRIDGRILRAPSVGRSPPVAGVCAGRTEAFRPDAVDRQSEPNERIRGRLNERRRSADVRPGRIAKRRRRGVTTTTRTRRGSRATSCAGLGYASLWLRGPGDLASRQLALPDEPEDRAATRTCDGTGPSCRIGISERRDTRVAAVAVSSTARPRPDGRPPRAGDPVTYAGRASRGERRAR